MSMTETEALASERKALARKVVHLERLALDLGNRLKVTRGAPGLRDAFNTTQSELETARTALATFDHNLMDD